MLQKLARIVLMCHDPLRLAGFYEAAFGFTRATQAVVTDPAFAKLLNLPGATAETVTLRLAEQEILLVGVQPPGLPYPLGVLGTSLLFQHFAITVAAMAPAYARLLEQRGWTAISTDGPQALPVSSGGVTAFKFRDPEGHPLELITSADGAQSTPEQPLFLHVDHSAISVANTARSVEFYAGLGLSRVGGSLNVGREQDRLDAVSGARVEVTALATPDCPRPHLELLCYAERVADHSPPAANDVAATWLVYTVANDRSLEAVLQHDGIRNPQGPVQFDDGSVRALFRDPDGHWICVAAP